ncbi:unnamed protein product [Camellia sinensis]
MNSSDCDLCFSEIETQILYCLPFQYLCCSGRLFYDGCYLRYGDYMFFNESLSGLDRTMHGSSGFVSGNEPLFRKNVRELVRNLSFRITATATIEIANALQQCLKFELSNQPFFIDDYGF